MILRRVAVSRMVRGCLLGILIACAYNFLFINGEIGKLSELSYSEEKAAYGIRLLAIRTVAGAIIGAVLGAVAEAILKPKNSHKQ